MAIAPLLSKPRVGDFLDRLDDNAVDPSHPQEQARSLSTTATRLKANAKANVGQRIVQAEMPSVLIAIISFVEAIRPYTLHAAKRIVPGTENRSPSGRT